MQNLVFIKNNYLKFPTTHNLTEWLQIHSDGALMALLILACSLYLAAWFSKKHWSVKWKNLFAEKKNHLPVFQWNFYHERIDHAFWVNFFKNIFQCKVFDTIGSSGKTSSILDFEKLGKTLEIMRAKLLLHFSEWNTWKSGQNAFLFDFF